MSATVIIRQILGSMPTVKASFDAHLEELYAEDPFCRVCERLIEDRTQLEYGSEFVWDGKSRELTEYCIHQSCVEQHLERSLERSITK